MIGQERKTSLAPGGYTTETVGSASAVIQKKLGRKSRRGLLPCGMAVGVGAGLQEQVQQAVRGKWVCRKCGLPGQFAMWQCPGRQ